MRGNETNVGVRVQETGKLEESKCNLEMRRWGFIREERGGVKI